MGQQARDGRGLRQGRQATPRRVPSDERPASGAEGRRETCGAISNASPDPLARNFVLQGFERDSDELRIELHLRPVSLDQLRRLFDVGDDTAMCNAYPVDHTKAEALAPLVSEPLDTSRYDFFLQRHA